MPYEGVDWATWKDVTNQRIHFLGGSNEAQQWTHTNAFYFDVDNQSFVTEPGPSQPLRTASVHGSVQVGSYIYYQTVNMIGRGVGRYNVETGAFNFPLSGGLPDNNPGSCLATDGRFVFYIGSEYHAGLQVYDTDLLQWLPRGPEMSARHRGGACQAVNGALFVFGGLDGGYDFDYLNTIEKLVVGVGDEVWTNLELNSWSVLVATLITGRGFAPSVRCDKVDQNLVYLVGGVKGTEGNWRGEWSIEVFDVDTETISLLSDTTRQQREDATAVCFRNRLYLFGGCTYGTNSNNCNLRHWEVSNELFVFIPTTAPTPEPTRSPTSTPTDAPTLHPSSAPTFPPTSAPSDAPTTSPSSAPTFPPTTAPSDAPSEPPTSAPSVSPTSLPTTTGSPTRYPTRSPGALATRRPTSSTAITTDDSGPDGANNAASVLQIALVFSVVMAYLMK